MIGFGIFMINWVTFYWLSQNDQIGFASSTTIRIAQGTTIGDEKGAWGFGTAHDCLASHACVPGSNLADRLLTRCWPAMFS